jgi:hypothetical protein
MWNVIWVSNPHEFKVVRLTACKLYPYVKIQSKTVAPKYTVYCIQATPKQVELAHTGNECKSTNIALDV